MADDELAAEMAEIRGDIEAGLDWRQSANINLAPRVARGASRLLAAVGAVLRLAEAAIPMLEALGGCAGHDGEFRPGCDCADGLPTAWTLDPEAVRSAVLAALTGKGGIDGQ